MGSKNGSVSGSDADTLEPVRGAEPVKEIPDSDSEDEFVKTAQNNKGYDSDGKMQRIIERINADSDRSDEEQNPPVDFGEEEEDDEKNSAPAEAATGKSEADKHDEDMEIEKPEDSDDDKQADKKNSVPVKKKKSTRKSSAPTKVIKKAPGDQKGKSKSAKAKSVSVGTSKKKENGSKPGSPVPKKDLHTKGSPTASPKGEKKAVSKTKVSGKSSGKVIEGVKSKTKSKAIKAKKTIDKGDGNDGEKTPTTKKKGKALVLKKTFSKKVGKPSSKGDVKTKKEAIGKKVKSAASSSDKKPKKKSKSKQEAEDSEGSSAAMVVESDDEEENLEEPLSEEEELTHTPASKLPILGNLACSSRDGNAQALLDHAVQQLGRYNVVPYGVEMDVRLRAYIIGSQTKRGWGVLQALVSGFPLVSEDWLSQSISAGSWKPIDAFRSDRFGQSPRSVVDSDGLNRLLDGMRIKVFCEGKDSTSVRKIVSMCGGRVAETRVDLVINDTKKRVEGSPNVTKRWLADSIEKGVKCDEESYSTWG